jgi:rod shape determining protein RodA
LMSLYSVGLVNPGNVFWKQLSFVAIGMVPFSIFFLTPPNAWRRTASFLYFINLGVLAWVLIKGKQINHAERWIMLPGHIEFQPSELAKLLTILTLSAFYAKRQDSVHKFSTFALGFLHVLLPMILIFKQPHLGATMTIFLMWAGVSLIAGVPGKYLGTFLVTAAVLATIGMSLPQFRNKILKPYQQGRVDDKKEYQTNRAEIAFGVGGATGVGFLHGEQKAGKFIPEQVNDFIVTVIGEEGGLVGCTLLLITYGFFFYRIFLVMLNATNPFYRMVASGIFVVLGFHTFVNIAMVLHIVPVVGLWLPFMSAGGTALWLCMACVGMLLAIRRKERPLLF